jgi:tetratricopeptide (TPR) repeat protein
MNFQHKCDIISAEIARVEGSYWEALKYYQKAIANAGENLFLHEQALASELAGEMFSQQNIPDIAQHYIKEACNCYTKWNAWMKIQELHSKYPQWVENEQCLTYKPITEASNNLDMESIIKAYQTISKELDFHILTKNLLNIVLENAGAQRVFLLRTKGTCILIAESAQAANRS